VRDLGDMEVPTPNDPDAYEIDDGTSSERVSDTENLAHVTSQTLQHSYRKNTGSLRLDCGDPLLISCLGNFTACFQQQPPVYY